MKNSARFLLLALVGIIWICAYSADSKAEKAASCNTDTYKVELFITSW